MNDLIVQSNNKNTFRTNHNGISSKLMVTPTVSPLIVMKYRHCLSWMCLCDYFVLSNGSNWEFVCIIPIFRVGTGIPYRGSCVSPAPTCHQNTSLLPSPDGRADRAESSCQRFWHSNFTCPPGFWRYNYSQCPFLTRIVCI